MKLTQAILVLTIGSVLASCGSGKKSGNDSPGISNDTPAENAGDPDEAIEPGLTCSDGKVKFNSACVPPLELVTTSAAGHTNVMDKSYFLYRVVEGESAALYYAPRNTRLVTANGMPIISRGVGAGQIALLNAAFSLVPSSQSANYRELGEYAASQGLILKRALIAADAEFLMSEEYSNKSEANVKLSGESTDARDATVSVFLKKPGTEILEKSLADYDFTPADFIKLQVKLKMGEHTVEADIALRIGCVKIDADNTVTSRKTDGCAAYWAF